jgi:hypothetical protein
MGVLMAGMDSPVSILSFITATPFRRMMSQGMTV